MVAITAQAVDPSDARTASFRAEIQTADGKNSKFEISSKNSNPNFEKFALKSKFKFRIPNDSQIIGLPLNGSKSFRFSNRPKDL